MQTRILDMSPPVASGKEPRRVLSFGPFIRFLKKRDQETDFQKTRFFKYVIGQFNAHPELLGEVDVNSVNKYPNQLQLIYNALSPIVENERSQFWGLALPLSPTIFYSTHAFYGLVADITTGELRKSIAAKRPENLKKKQLALSYGVILEKCFNIPNVFPQEMIHSMEDESTGLLKYYRMNLDARFMDVKMLQPIPDFNISSLQLLQSRARTKEEVIHLLEEALPLDLFQFEGFGITTITDVTDQYSIERIKNIIVSHPDFEQEHYYKEVIQSLKILVGNNDIQFGLLPVLQVNGKLVFHDATCMNSKLIRTAREQGIAETAYLSLADEYLKNPRMLLFREILPADEDRFVYLKILKDQGVVSYALAPVFFNNSLAGVLEVHSLKKDILDETLISKLDPVIPLLSQLLKNNIDEFNGAIDKIIKEKFTAIQPSVQWKFNEAALKYLMESRHGDHLEIEEVLFEKVYPLYGAIDIRNSTIERNAALIRDLNIQFSVLIGVLQKLKAASGLGLIDEKIFQSQKWLNEIKNQQPFAGEIALNDFLENDITPFLINLVEGNQELSQVAEEYFRAIDERNGSANESRRQLEASMTTVISAVNNYLEKLKTDIQQAYPSYFEKFRTDGVEYDIYIGQSIAPNKPYSDIYLKNLRLLQMTSMSAIVKLSHALQPTLERPVQTTQLIFIHSHPIDIKFRKDEKRFDVEGAYNIRYHIVKKRIDKVHIRNSDERLTQPDKIALVYFNQKEADEYISYIHYLQDEKVLNDDLEYLELEELQGISGLKALRVGVNLIQGEVN